MTLPSRRPSLSSPLCRNLQLASQQRQQHSFAVFTTQNESLLAIAILTVHISRLATIVAAELHNVACQELVCYKEGVMLPSIWFKQLLASSSCGLLSWCLSAALRYKLHASWWPQEDCYCIRRPALFMICFYCDNSVKELLWFWQFPPLTTLATFAVWMCGTVFLHCNWVWECTFACCSTCLQFHNAQLPLAKTSCWTVISIKVHCTATLAAIKAAAIPSAGMKPSKNIH